jgi:hypothetical protein
LFLAVGATGTGWLPTSPLQKYDVGERPELAFGDPDSFGFVDGEDEVFERGGGFPGDGGDEPPPGCGPLGEAEALRVAADELGDLCGVGGDEAGAGSADFVVGDPPGEVAGQVDFEAGDVADEVDRNRESDLDRFGAGGSEQWRERDSSA